MQMQKKDLKESDKNMVRKNKRVDSAEEFKQKSLNAIERRKKLKKITFSILIVVAALMVLAVVAAYMLD